MSAKSLGKIGYSLGLTVWVVLALFVGQALAALLIFNVPFAINSAVQTTIAAAFGYAFGLLLALGVPALASRKWVTKSTLGLDRVPKWSDIGLSILSVLPYYILSGVVVYIGLELFKVIDPKVGQQIAFDNLTLQIEYAVAFVTLVIMAPFAEELLFRGYFLGRMKEKTGKWVALIVTALVFGGMHLIGTTQTGIVLQWAAAADTFAMALVAGSLRLLSGSIWAGVLLHAMKNAIAYYFLFINPLPPS